MEKHYDEHDKRNTHTLTSIIIRILPLSLTLTINLT